MNVETAPLFEKPEATLEQVALADICPWSSGGAKSRSAKSIAVLGLRGVVTLKRLAPGSSYRYEVVDGSRRLNKARDQGLEFVNAEVLPEDTDRVEAAALRTPDDVPVTDVDGTLLPGLVDCHVHLVASGAFPGTPGSLEWAGTAAPAGAQ